MNAERLWACLLVGLCFVAGCRGRSGELPKNPVEECVRNGDESGLAKYLGEPGVPDEALRFAAQFGKADLVPMLVEKGADPKKVDADGVTPLHEAAQAGHVDVVKALLDSGADANARDALGRTPLDYAEEWGRDETIALLKERSGGGGR